MWNDLNKPIVELSVHKSIISMCLLSNDYDYGILIFIASTSLSLLYF